MRVLILAALLSQACVTPQQQCMDANNGNPSAYNRCMSESYARDRAFADSMNGAAAQIGTISAPKYYRPEPPRSHCVTRPNYIGEGYTTDCN